MVQWADVGGARDNGQALVGLQQKSKNSGYARHPQMSLHLVCPPVFMSACLLIAAEPSSDFCGGCWVKYGRCSHGRKLLSQTLLSASYPARVTEE